MRYDMEEKEYIWQKKRRRSGDKGKTTDRRRKVANGVILEDFERRQKDDPEYQGLERRSGEDRRRGKDRRE